MDEVKLTYNQKKVLIEYLLGGVSKGFFEDCEEFWEDVPPEQIDELYPAYREKVHNFVLGTKYEILDRIGSQ